MATERRGDSGEVLPASASLTAEAKAEMRQWLERWKLAGPILEAERWARLRTSSDDQLRQQSVDLLNVWQPGVPGDDGEAIVLQQRVFTRLTGRSVGKANPIRELSRPRYARTSG